MAGGRVWMAVKLQLQLQLSVVVGVLGSVGDGRGERRREVIGGSVSFGWSRLSFKTRATGVMTTGKRLPSG